MTATATGDFATTLNDAIQGGYLARLSGGTYAISAPIVIHVTRSMQGPLGIDGGGATLVSQVTNGQPLIQIIADPGVDLRYLTLSNFTIQGNGHEGDGIRIVASSTSQDVYNWTISDVTVRHVGGHGLSMEGNIFEGVISNAWMIGNALDGAHFAHSAAGGVASALRWIGGGARDNGGAGIRLDQGTRDLVVEDAAFIGNGGGGISARWGITEVSDSTFQDNAGFGVYFWNYGNFNDNTFSTAGTQGIGIKGYLAGNATLIGNTSLYTGSGGDPSVLADLQGSGGAFLAGDTGTIVAGKSVAVSGAGGGNLAQVVVASQDVTVPALAPVTAVTTAPAAESHGTGALETALKAAIADGTVAHLGDAVHTITAPITVHITSSHQGAIGIDLGGAKIFSRIATAAPVIEIVVAPGVEVSQLTLSNFSLYGRGSEGDGIKIVADGVDRLIRDLKISNVNVEGVGGIGLDVLGNVAHATVFNSWMHADRQGGARFANSAGGGVASDLEWIGGGFRKNGIAGLILDNGAHDMRVEGAYFVENKGPGIHATSGITLVQGSGFENNQGVGAFVKGAAVFMDDSFSTWGPQTVGVGGMLAGDQVTLIGVVDEYYGSGNDPTVLANVQGAGALAIAGDGKVIVGRTIAVGGVDPAVIPADSPAGLIAGTPYDDMLRGYAGDDCLVGYAGNDVLDGGAGIDTAAYAANAGLYRMVVFDGLLVVAGSEGVDLLQNIEQVAFADLTTSAFPSAYSYIASYGDLIMVFGANGQAGLNHFRSYGAYEGRQATFDGLDYIASYGDLATVFGASDEAGALHFIRHGMREGRPTTFNGLEYVASYGDLMTVFGANDDAGARHFIDHGRFEGRQTSFDGLQYIGSYGDLMNVFGTNPDAGAKHFIEYGRFEGRQTSFDGLRYIASYGDLIAAFGANEDAGARHFIEYGRFEGRSIQFDPAAYLSSYVDLQLAFGANLELAAQHFITHGYFEGRH